MFKSLKKRLSKLPPIVLVILGVILVAGLAYGGYRILHKSSPETITTEDGKKVILKPATKNERQETDANKDAIVQADQKAKTESASTSSQKQSTVVIASTSSSGVSAYVTGIFEEGGTCSATATQAGKTSSGLSTGFQNASYTQCAPITWDTALTPGSWIVTVNYKSLTTSSSQTVTTEVN